MLIHSPPQTVKVTVSGVFYSSGSCKSLVSKECEAQIEVSLERYDPFIGSDLGWVPEANAAVVSDSTASSPLLFSGTVTLPSAPSIQPKQQGQGQQLSQLAKYRFVLKEYEELPVTPPVHSVSIQKVQGSFAFLQYPGEAISHVTANNQRRLVYADQIEL